MDLYAVLYALGVVACSGALHADLMSITSEYPDLQQKLYRSNLASSVGLSLIPLTWLLSPFLTGFYEHGWQLRRTQPPKGNLNR